MSSEEQGKSVLQEIKDAVAGAEQSVVDAASNTVEAIEAGLKKLEEEAVEDLKKAKQAAIAVEEKVVKFFQTKFGFPLHDPTQSVTVSPTDPTEAEHTPWIQSQIEAGTIVEVKS